MGKENGTYTLTGTSTTMSNISLDEGATTDTTIWRGGWVTDNWDTYYLDENMVRRPDENTFNLK